jgi:hypothetical protein
MTARPAPTTISVDQANPRKAVVAGFESEPGFSVSEAWSPAEARRMLKGVDVAILNLVCRTAAVQT